MYAYSGHSKIYISDKVIEVINHMLQIGLKPSRNMYESVIKIWANSKRPDAPRISESIFKSMIETTGVVTPPSIEIFNLLMKVWATSMLPNAVKKVQEVYQTIVDANIKPTAATDIKLTDTNETKPAEMNETKPTKPTETTETKPTVTNNIKPTETNDIKPTENNEIKAIKTEETPVAPTIVSDTDSKFMGDQTEKKPIDSSPIDINSENKIANSSEKVERNSYPLMILLFIIAILLSLGFYIHKNIDSFNTAFMVYKIPLYRGYVYQIGRAHV
jgi:hypothetical protein